MHVAGGALCRHPEHLAAFVVPAATPVLLNLSVIAVGWALARPLERAGYPGHLRDGHRRHAGWRAAAAGAMAGAAGRRRAAAHAPDLARLSGSACQSRCRPRHARHGPGAARCRRVAAVVDDQHADLQPSGRGCDVLAELCGSADGVPHRPARRGPERGADARSCPLPRPRARASATAACSTGVCAWSCCWLCPVPWRCWCLPNR